MTQPDRFARMVEDSHFWALTDIDRQEVLALLRRYHARTVKIFSALQKGMYIRHHSQCRTVDTPMADCTCGLHHLLAALAALKKGTR